MNMQCMPYLIASFILAILLSLYAVPIVVKVAHSLRFMDNPNERSAAECPIPTLGGISIFLSFIFSSTLGLTGEIMPEFVYIIIAALLMFFVGLKDDILTLSARKKLGAQLMAAAIIIFLGKMRFTDLHGFLGIEGIGIMPGVILTFFAVIGIINAFNLMDGIDGLCAGLSMLAAAVFGSWFFISGHFNYAILSFSLVGAIAGFFWYNVYGTKNRIFMGDTGSLVLGTIMSVLVIQFNEFNIDQTQPFAIASAPAVSFGILIYPLVDTLRVFIIRILNFKSPFLADKNHLHHRLLTLGLSHKQATYTIMGMNFLFIVAVFALKNFGILNVMLFNLIIGGLLFMIPAYLIQKKDLIKHSDHQQQLLFPGAAFQLLKNRRKAVKVAKRRSAARALNLVDFSENI